LTVRERAHDTRAPPDLAQDALERVVGDVNRLEHGRDLPHLGRGLQVAGGARQQALSDAWRRAGIGRTEKESKRGQARPL
jgi:hypothetical protein